MIKSVTITNYLDETIKLELRSPEKSGLLVQKIDGLGPSKANVNVTEIATSDGGLYNSARVNSRNIVLSLGLLEKPTIEDTRHLTYKYFPLKKRVRLIFETDRRTSEIHGYVESNEPVIFSSRETTQISIVCPDPYFYSLGKQTTLFSGVEAGFEFPFSNESLTENLLEFGIISNRTENTVYYSGDSDVGVVITIHAIGNVENVTIFNVNTRESMKINTDWLQARTGSIIVAGDTIFITTSKGKKSVYLLREGAYINILNCLERGSAWFRLTKGDNVFAYIADYGIENLQFSIENQVVYEGV